MIDVLIIGGIFREILDGDTRPRLRYGGSALTASVSAARLGAHVAVASYVGDEDQEAVRAELEVAGVDHQSLLTVPGASGTFVFPTQQDSERPWPLYRPAEAVPESQPRPLPSARVIVAFGIPDFDPIASGWLAGIGTKATLLWDRQGWLSRARNASGVLALAGLRKIYLANEKEAMEDAGVTSIDEALPMQPPAGFMGAVIKRGILGVVVVEHSSEGILIHTVNPFPVHTRSSIGSGDVFAGALAARLSLGSPLLEAAKWGCAASSVALAAGSNLLTDDAPGRMDLLMSS